jgi:2-polyprenyl-6-methoxyphenol hydroxylase-like FAD-dependent oxidoreductase
MSREPAMVDVCVQGSGIVGSCLALSLARIGLSVDWVSAPRSMRPERPDVRAYALNATAVSLLRKLKVWDALPPGSATPVRDMRIEGDEPGSLLEFSAWQQGVTELAWIVDAAVLEQRLRDAIGFAAHVRTVAEPTEAALVAHCEGKHSPARDALGVRFDRHAYGHSALAARLVSDRPHEGVARQWFRSPDVLALLPLDTPEPGRSWALVWSGPDSATRHLMDLTADSFASTLSAATGGAAGRLELRTEPSVWPLMLARAERWCGPGWVLLGDAAHVVHPLAGQGLNLGLGDVVELTRVLAEREAWRSPGDERVLRRFERSRQGPTLAMGRLTDGLLHLFAAPAAPIRGLRNRGLDLVNRSGMAKRWLAERALDA